MATTKRGPGNNTGASFSDLNQLNDISMDTDYNEICGMTEREIIDNFSYELKN
ncbi:AAA family ATPase [Butyrivibrio fibrisolvens]|uniref:AAA family ATPase n=1 Tax=Butyrivibrio fibrisolvens TaxID=831 RepID=UPI003B507987